MTFLTILLLAVALAMDAFAVAVASGVQLRCIRLPQTLRMAGTFGYEARHIEVSMQMAELSLLPAVRNAPDALIVADGTSCRHQIRDGAQREAVHVARLLADHLGR